jgi:hypothetical protein
MVFHSHAGLNIDHIPDDIVIPNLIFDPKHGRRSLSQSNKSVLIDAPSGNIFDINTVKERTESLAKGFSQELNVNVGWNGVIGIFAPNHVPPFFGAGED